MSSQRKTGPFIKLMLVLAPLVQKTVSVLQKPQKFIQFAERFQTRQTDLNCENS